MCDFKVSFGNVARTIVYEDIYGVVCFAFDISPSEDNAIVKWSLQIGHQSLTREGSMLKCAPERVKIALERIKEFATSRGYLVEIG
jgi:hypothetical protein